MKYEPAKAVDDNTYSPGYLDCEWFLADLKSGEIKASGRIQAETITKVEFVYKNDGERRERLASFANSTLFEDARKKFVISLLNRTGGKFSID